jgi:metallopeptidase MepB
MSRGGYSRVVAMEQQLRTRYDIFHIYFAEDPLNAEEGRRYRRAILEKGWSNDGQVMMREYLGRDVRIDGFLKSF